MENNKCEYYRKRYDACSLKELLINLSALNERPFRDEINIDEDGGLIISCTEKGNPNCWARASINNLLGIEKKKDPSFDEDAWRKEHSAKD